MTQHTQTLYWLEGKISKKSLAIKPLLDEHSRPGDLSCRASPVKLHEPLATALLSVKYSDQVIPRGKYGNIVVSLLNFSTYLENDVNTQPVPMVIPVVVQVKKILLR